MPNHEIHCQESLRKYGKRFDALHTWMDEPYDIRGRTHRAFRHDPDATPQEARKLFGEFADHVCLDHIRLDQISSDEIASRGMDTDFCQRWQGDEKSKYCRVCTQPGEPCYELWLFVCQLASEGFVFTNNISGRAFGNRYRLESPNGPICYLQMLQGGRSRIGLPIEDFLYVTITGQGGMNQTPSRTRQYPFVNLLLEIIAAKPEGEYLINMVRNNRLGDNKLETQGSSVNNTSASEGSKIDLAKLEAIRIEYGGEDSDNKNSSQVNGGTCPRCGSPLVWRKARKTGESYRGCTNYRACRYNERSY